MFVARRPDRYADTAIVQESLPARAPTGPCDNSCLHDRLGRLQFL